MGCEGFRDQKFMGLFGKDKYSVKKLLLNPPLTGLTAFSLTLLGYSCPVVLGAIPDKATAGQSDVIPSETGQQKIAQIGQRGELYILGPGDRVQVDIFNVPEYSGTNGQHRVLVDGTLNLPLLPGPIYVQGLTLQQAARQVSEQYRPFLTNPIVTLSLLEPRPINIAVAGEVNRPGSYSLTPVGLPNTTGGAAVQVPTLTRALQAAGGVTQSADIRNVQIRSATGAGGSFDLSRLSQQAALGEDIPIRDGDSIFVPPLTSLTPQQASQLAVTSFSGDLTRPVNITVVGEVNRPGPYVVTRVDQTGGVLTVSRAIQTAGGLTGAADIQNIKVQRLTQTGIAQTITLNLLGLVRGSDLSQDVVLAPGDTIVVPTVARLDLDQAAEIANTSLAGDPTRPLNIAITGEVNRPGSYTVQRVDDKGGQLGLITVTRALQTAGGITQSADIRRIQVRRPTRQNTEQVINVDLWQLLQAGDLKQDIILGQNDTIVVPTSSNVNTAELAQLAVTSFAGDSTRPLNIAITGEVNRPGSYTVQRLDDEGAQLGVVTVTRALQTAGGITQTADIRRIQVRRPTREGTEQIIDVNLWQLLQSGDLNQDVILDQNDTIVVPTAEVVDLTETSQIGAANFSPSSIRVNVVGEVVKPGVVEVPPNTSLNQALLAAGGLDQLRAKTQEVELIRLNPNGTVSRRTLELDFSQELNENNNPSIRPNDVIVVGRSRITSLADTLSTVFSPVTNFLGVFRILQLFGL
jgi:polysaccharide biosynthesis/export protein